MTKLRRLLSIIMMATALAFGAALIVPVNETTAHAAPLFDDGCTSGGQGSTSCDAPGSGGSDGCSVTCGSGHYACCNGSGAASACRCIANP